MNLFQLWFYRNRTIFSWIWYQKKHSTNKDKDKFEILIFVRLSLFLSLFGKDNSNFVPPLLRSRKILTRIKHLFDVVAIFRL